MRAMLALMISAAAGVAASAAAAQPPAEGLDVDRCILTTRGALLFGVRLPERVAPGETVAIFPRWSPFPSWFTEVPIRCFTDWRVSDRAVATLSRDRATLRIAAGAPVGATITLTARYNERELRHQFTVIRRVASPLVGRWRPVEGTCPQHGDLRVGNSRRRQLRGRNGDAAALFSHCARQLAGGRRSAVALRFHRLGRERQPVHRFPAGSAFHP